MGVLAFSWIQLSLAGKSAVGEPAPLRKPRTVLSAEPFQHNGNIYIRTILCLIKLECHLYNIWNFKTHTTIKYSFHRAFLLCFRHEFKQCWISSIDSFRLIPRHIPFFALSYFMSDLGLAAPSSCEENKISDKGGIQLSIFLWSAFHCMDKTN